MKYIPGYLFSMLFLYLAVSVWYDNDVHRIVHSTVFGLATAFCLIGMLGQKVKK